MKRIGKKQKVAPECAAQEHIKALNLNSPAEYFLWCRNHGFPDRLNKHRKQRVQELHLADQLAKQSNPIPRILPLKSPIQQIRGLCEGKLQAVQISLPYVKHFAERLIATELSEPIDKLAMMEFVQRLGNHRCKYLLEYLPANSRLGTTPDNTFLAGLSLLAAYRLHWLRPLSTWQASSHNPRKQFSSLFHHLLDKHGEIPECFVSAWFQANVPEALQHRQWSIALGAGNGLRGCDLPIAYSRSLWQSLRQSPEHLLVNESLRWSQVISYGGSVRLAEALLSTRIVNDFSAEEFWSDVIKWFIANPMLDCVHVGPIVDYLYHQRFVPVIRVDLTGNPVEPQPLQPKLTMKGRTVESLLRAVQGWHNSMRHLNADPKTTWPSTGIRPLIWEEGDPKKNNHRIWRIRELLNRGQLIVEGRKLHHCVASYATSCMRGEASIWTLELEANEFVDKLITVEVRPQPKLIVQARGRSNRWPTEMELSVLQRWATLAGLKVRL